jgi:hypothetical protein
LNGEYGVARKVTMMNGTATRVGKNDSVKNGIMNGRLPIIMCKNFRELLGEIFRDLAILLETRMMMNM